LLLPLLLPVDLPVVEAPDESPELEAPDEAAALLSEFVVLASLLSVDEGWSEESLLDESAVDFALEASDVLEAAVVDSAADKELDGDHVRLQRFLQRTRVVLSREDKVVDFANGF
jgi:hypothetical protein